MNIEPFVFTMIEHDGRRNAATVARLPVHCVRKPRAA
jgi:hypothetical protein